MPRGFWELRISPRPVAARPSRHRLFAPAHQSVCWFSRYITEPCGRQPVFVGRVLCIDDTDQIAVLMNKARSTLHATTPHAFSDSRLPDSTHRAPRLLSTATLTCRGVRRCSTRVRGLTQHLPTADHGSDSPTRSRIGNRRGNRHSHGLMHKAVWRTHGASIRPLCPVEAWVCHTHFQLQRPANGLPTQSGRFLQSPFDGALRPGAVDAWQSRRDRLRQEQWHLLRRRDPDVVTWAGTLIHESRHIGEKPKRRAVPAGSVFGAENTPCAFFIFHG